MKHLTFEEIAEFVTIERSDERALKLIAEVTAHIRECETCRRLTEDLQRAASAMEYAVFDKKLSNSNDLEL